jgi:hypothetical protein
MVDHLIKKNRLLGERVSNFQVGQEHIFCVFCYFCFFFKFCLKNGLKN